MEPLQEDLDFLEHFGVKGMKWGQRKEARATNRQLNRESRMKDRASAAADRNKEYKKYQTDIDKARARIDSGKNDRALKKAKAEYAENKRKLGSREAKKILNQVKAKNWEDYNTAQQVRDGNEAAKAIVASVGASLVVGLLSSAVKG